MRLVHGSEACSSSGSDRVRSGWLHRMSHDDADPKEARDLTRSSPRQRRVFAWFVAGMACLLAAHTSPAWLSEDALNSDWGTALGLVLLVGALVCLAAADGDPCAVCAIRSLIEDDRSRRTRG